MKTAKDATWYHYPPVVLPSPVLALATVHDGLWAGGPGGVAWYPIHTDWQPRISGLPLTSVASLVVVEGRLIAGGTEGIAYSQDGGQSWQSAEMQDNASSILAFVVSPAFTQDRTILAATLENGILRSDDGGTSWRLTTFGLQNFEATALAWDTGETVLVGTTDSIYRSINGGRSWRATKNSDGYEVGALTYLPDGTALAALESGGLLYSIDNGMTWNEQEAVPSNYSGSALFVTSEGTLLWGTVGDGILRSTDNGQTWQSVHESTVLSFTAHGNTLYAGLADGLSVSVDDGITWISLPHPPIHDLRRILIFDGQPLLVGTYAGLQRYGSRQAWTALTIPGVPLSVVAQAPGGVLVAANLDGLARSNDDGQTWQMIQTGEMGQITHITFRADGTGWAGSADGALLLRTRDAGTHWEQLEVPFGVLPLAALQITADGLMAATYDLRELHAHIWRSQDEGVSWQRGLEAETAWPIVAMWQEPALFTLGATLFLQQDDGQWIPKNVGNGREGIRRVVATNKILIVQTTNDIYTSTDEGETWKADESDLPVDQVLDMQTAEGTLYVLLTGGRVWSHPIEA